MDPHRYTDRGPGDSQVYNDRMREFTGEVSEVYEKLHALAADVDDIATLAALDADAIGTFLESLKLTTAAAQAANLAANTCFIPVAGLHILHDNNGAPTLNDGTVIAQGSRLLVDGKGAVLTLPQGPRISKLRTVAQIDGDDVTIVHPEVQAAYTYTGSAESSSSVDDGIDGNYSTAFTIEDTDTTFLGRLAYYVRVPVRGVATDLTNVIDVTLAPLAYCRLLGLQYTTDPEPKLDATDNWQNFQVTVDADDADYYPPQVGADPENPTYVQQNFSTRRYYVNEEKITAVRLIVGPRKDGGGAPVTLTAGGTERLVFGVRDVDASHVSFASSGRLVFEVMLPVAVGKIISVVPRVINDRYVATVPDVTCYAETVPGTWSEIAIGSNGDALGGATAIRVQVDMAVVNRTTSPIVSGFDIEYEL